jgi:hypothetical protein
VPTIRAVTTADAGTQAVAMPATARAEPQDSRSSASLSSSPTASMSSSASVKRVRATSKALTPVRSAMIVSSLGQKSANTTDLAPARSSPARGSPFPAALATTTTMTAAPSLTTADTAGPLAAAPFDPLFVSNPLLRNLLGADATAKMTDRPKDTHGPGKAQSQKSTGRAMSSVPATLLGSPRRPAAAETSAGKPRPNKSKDKEKSKDKPKNKDKDKNKGKDKVKDNDKPKDKDNDKPKVKPTSEVKRPVPAAARPPSSSSKSQSISSTSSSISTSASSPFTAPVRTAAPTFSLSGDRGAAASTFSLSGDGGGSADATEPPAKKPRRIKLNQ